MTQNHSSYTFYNQYGGGESSPIQIDKQVGTLIDILKKNNLLFKKINFLSTSEQSKEKEFQSLLANYNLFNLSESELIIVSKNAKYKSSSDKNELPIDNLVINNLINGLAKSKQKNKELAKYNPNKVIRVSLEIIPITDSSGKPLTDNENNPIKIVSKITLLQTTNKIMVSRLIDLKNTAYGQYKPLFDKVFDKIDLEKKIVPKLILDKCLEIGIMKDLIKLTQLWGLLQNIPTNINDPKNNRFIKKNRILSELKSLSTSILLKIETSAVFKESGDGTPSGISSSLTPSRIKTYGSKLGTPSAVSSGFPQQPFRQQTIPQTLPTKQAMANGLTAARNQIKGGPSKKGKKSSSQPVAPPQPAQQQPQQVQQQASQMPLLAAALAAFGGISQNPGRTPSDRSKSGKSGDGSSILNGPKGLVKGVFDLVGSPFKAAGDKLGDYFRRNREKKEVAHRRELELAAKGEITDADKKALVGTFGKSIFEKAERKAAQLKTEKMVLASLQQQYQTKREERDSAIQEYNMAINNGSHFDIVSRLKNKISILEGNLSDLDIQIQTSYTQLNETIQKASEYQTAALKEQSTDPVKYAAYKASLKDEDLKLPPRIKYEPSPKMEKPVQGLPGLPPPTEAQKKALEPIETIVNKEKVLTNTEFKDANQAAETFKPILTNFKITEKTYKETLAKRDAKIVEHNKLINEGKLPSDTEIKGIRDNINSLKTLLKNLYPLQPGSLIPFEKTYLHAYEQLEKAIPVALKAQQAALSKQLSNPSYYVGYRPALTDLELTLPVKIEYEEGARLLDKAEVKPKPPAPAAPAAPGAPGKNGAAGAPGKNGAAGAPGKNGAAAPAAAAKPATENDVIQTRAELTEERAEIATLKAQLEDLIQQLLVANKSLPQGATAQSPEFQAFQQLKLEVSTMYQRLVELYGTDQQLLSTFQRMIQELTTQKQYTVKNEDKFPPIERFNLSPEITQLLGSLLQVQKNQTSTQATVNFTASANPAVAKSQAELEAEIIRTQTTIQQLLSVEGVAIRLRERAIRAIVAAGGKPPPPPPPAAAAARKAHEYVCCLPACYQK